MKTLIPLLGIALMFGNPLSAQDPATPPLIPVVTGANFTAEQLDQLLGPIALYPDALIALILPASTVSSDVVLASRYLRDGGDGNQAENQPWDDSVRALSHYADVVKWMDDNLAWTKQLGEAFVAQPAEVMNSVQRLRARARAAGTLVDTPQQQVAVEANTIRIVPSQPDVIYVPYYDPDVVYVSQPGYYPGYSFFNFSAPFATGFWLSYNLDWGHRRVWVVNRRDREHFWYEHRNDGRPLTYAVVPPNVHPWVPRPSYVNPGRTTVTPRVQPQIVRPVPFANVARPQNDPRQGTPDRRRDFSAQHQAAVAPTPNAPEALPAPRVYSRAGNASAPAPQVPASNPLPQPMSSPLPTTPAPAVTNPTTRGDYRRGDQPRVYYVPPAGTTAPAPGGYRSIPVNPNPAPVGAVPPPRYIPPAQIAAPAQVAPAPAAPAQTAPAAPVRPEEENSNRGRRGNDR